MEYWYQRIQVVELRLRSEVDTEKAFAGRCLKMSSTWIHFDGISFNWTIMSSPIDLNELNEFN